MPELDYTETRSPTLIALDEAMERKAARASPRRYLGLSSLGEECSRKLWYRFRWYKQERFSAQTLRMFEDGHTQETIAAERLREIPGILLKTHDDAGNQFGVSLFNDLIRGHCDGIITGVKEAPATPHIWEHKSCGDKTWKKLITLIESIDQKEVLEKWNFTYYAQAVLYMHLFELKRHFMTVSTPGGRDYVAIRTNAAPKVAKGLIEKGKAIIDSKEPPPRAFNKRDYYQCNWCPFQSICWGDESGRHAEAPAKNCRTCAHATPGEPDWQCEENPENLVRIGRSLEPVGCDKHLFIPHLAGLTPVQITPKGIEYKGTGGEYYYINPKGSGDLTA